MPSSLASAMAARTEVSPSRFPRRRLARCFARWLALWNASRRVGLPARLLLPFRLRVVRGLRVNDRGFDLRFDLMPGLSGEKVPTLPEGDAQELLRIT